MSSQETTAFEDVKRFYARYMGESSQSNDPRIEQAFYDIAREDFLPPGPWKIATSAMGHFFLVKTPGSNPIHLYQNSLVVLDEEEKINNGQPSLHATWIGAIAPQAGETIIQVGAGMGYYTAILARLVEPRGQVIAYEINENLGLIARTNLKSFSNTTIEIDSAVEAQLPETDIIYVNASVTAPPVSWLKSLKPGGRLIFPWQPSAKVGLTTLVRKHADGYAIEFYSPCLFIPCKGASEENCLGTELDYVTAKGTRSLWLQQDREPDSTATAIYKNVWFSKEKIGK